MTSKYFPSSDPESSGATRATHHSEEADKLSEKQTCAICLDVPKPGSRSTLENCSHEFCFTCISEWSLTINSCPLCKRKFGKIFESPGRKVHAVATPRKSSQEEEEDESDDEDYSEDEEQSFFVGSELESDSDEEHDHNPPSVIDLVSETSGVADESHVEIVDSPARRFRLISRNENDEELCELMSTDSEEEDMSEGEEDEWATPSSKRTRLTVETAGETLGSSEEESEDEYMVVEDSFIVPDDEEEEDGEYE
jgi:hypothetical protein